MNEQGDRLDLKIKQMFASMKKLGTKPASCPDEQLLGAYYEGNLTPEEVERIDEHLALCERCTEDLIALSEVMRSYDSTKDTLATKEMLKRAKNLVKPTQTPSLWERFSSWFSSFRPAPLMTAGTVVLLLMVFGIYTLYSPYEGAEEKGTPIIFSIIAKMPSGMVTRGTPPDDQEVEVSDGGVLHSGDMFKIRFELKKGAYVYVLALDSLGNLTRLFPEKVAGAPVRVSAKKAYIFPEKDRWLLLDNNPGLEKFYLIASPEPISDIEKKISQLKNLGTDEISKMFPGVKIQALRFKHE